MEGNDVYLLGRTKPLCQVPEMLYGNKIVDGGNYLLTDEEKEELINQEPGSQEFIKPILSGDEFINGKNRWVIYLHGANPSILKKLPLISERINAVRKIRLASTKQQTRELANFPTEFAEPRQPVNNFLLIPRTTSENRRFIPLGFFTPDFIVNDSCTALPMASFYHFGMLSSSMHMSWVRYTCGRLESRYRYSNTIVYNNYPWPLSPTEKQKQAVEAAAQVVLDTRVLFPDSSLADLYDPNTMPPALVKAHQVLDKAVDQCYRTQPFLTEAKRIEYLFELYDTYTSGLFPAEKKGRKKKGG